MDGFGIGTCVRHVGDTYGLPGKLLLACMGILFVVAIICGGAHRGRRRGRSAAG